MLTLLALKTWQQCAALQAKPHTSRRKHYLDPVMRVSLSQQDTLPADTPSMRYRAKATVSKLLMIQTTDTPAT